MNDDFERYLNEPEDEIALDLLESIPTLEIPGLPELAAAMERLDAFERRLYELEKDITKVGDRLKEYHKTSGTLLSGMLPGGVIHDRVAEARAAVHELLNDPENPSSSAVRAAVALNWGQMSTEE